MQSSVNLDRLSERRRKNFKKFAKLLPLKQIDRSVRRHTHFARRAIKNESVALSENINGHSLSTFTHPRALSPSHTHPLSHPMACCFLRSKTKKKESRRKSEARSCLCKYTVKNNKEKFSFYTIQNKTNKTSCALSNESDSFFKNIISN